MHSPDYLRNLGNNSFERALDIAQHFCGAKKVQKYEDLTSPIYSFVNKCGETWVFYVVQQFRELNKNLGIKYHWMSLGEAKGLYGDDRFDVLLNKLIGKSGMKYR